MTTSVGNNSVFRSFFEKQKLTWPNFIDWYRQLWLVISTEDKEKYLEQPIPAAPVDVALDQPISPQALATYNEWVKNQKEIVVMMQEEGQSVSSYVLKMKSYIDQLERLGHPVTLNLGVCLILIGLSKEYDSFVQNYNMHNMGKTVNELHAMLKLHEETLPKKVAAPALHAIWAGKVQKNKNRKPSKAAKGVQGKGKGKKVYAKAEPSYAPKPKIPPPLKKDNPAKDAICHHCGEVGHWRRNYPTYLIELLKKKNLAQGASTSGIFTIELYNFPTTSWVYDTSCGTHICNTTQGLWGSKKLNPGALSLYVCNGQREAVEAIGNHHLCFPSGLVIVLNNFHYAPFITRGIVSVSRLYDDGFINRFELNNTISVSKNNVVYFTAIPRDGLFEIEMSCSNTNDSSIKKRIQKLQHDGLLNSTDIESLGKCVSCMSGKMARKPYSHQVERAKDLLGLIHTDEVENQLGKTIKSLRSDRGGEYMSQDFLDHLNEHGIIAHRTPPYTPQHKGVSERRNRTLPDMSNLLDQEASGSLEDLEIIQEEDTNPSIDTSLNHEDDDQEINEPQGDINPIRRSTRTKRASDRMCLYVDAKEYELGDHGEPINYKAALLDPESKKWLASMNVEMQSMKDNDVWELIELPPNAKTVGHKWLFKKKTDMDGAVHTFKSRLVAKGFTQTYGVDYEETFSHVEDIRAIRILIVITAFYDYEIWQMDVKTAFFNGHLSEEVYMTQPEGFVNPKYPNHVCKLKRSICGLKQASRQWNKRFDDEIKKFGFTQNHDEPCVYQKASGSYVTFLILYVDDILIMGNNIPMLQDVKSYLGRCFAMKDLGEAAYILGIKIYRDRSKWLIEKIKLSKSDGSLTPAEVRRMSRVPYALTVGSIMYAVRCTRPDVALAQNITSRYQQNPGELHWTTVKNILKYLWNTKGA
ncbi:retrotransposon protein, putative, ty1-copia subclass [Tanacetum coccineum]